MKTLMLLLLACALALAACGGDDDETPAQPGGNAALEQQDADAEPEAEDDTDDDEAAAKEKGTRVTLGDSEFGTMLFDSKQQAIYIFEIDPKGKSACYGDCAEAWPPVFTDGKPVAGKGVDAKLLGTTRRRDGKLQVTYADQPLYYYAHEGPGEVRCHNVNLNGGFWWVVGPDGKRRA
jgi:predicted lipoprotein with Yx(FWY)xxD motif